MKMEQTPKSPKFFIKLGILVGFIVETASATFGKMSEAELQLWIGKKELIRKQLREIFNRTDLYAEEREVWRKFYQKYFQFDINVADMFIPENPTDGDWRLIVVAQGLTLNQVYKCMSETFKCGKYVDDLDASVTKNTRDTKEAYAVWVRVGAEPDEKYLDKSTNQADPNMKIGMTLMERMLLEIIYFDETGKHLDIEGWTLCSGSRSSDGDVPSVDWYSDDQLVWVSWSCLDFSGARYGLREAVS